MTILKVPFLLKCSTLLLYFPYFLVTEANTLRRVGEGGASGNPFACSRGFVEAVQTSIEYLKDKLMVMDLVVKAKILVQIL